MDDVKDEKEDEKKENAFFRVRRDLYLRLKWASATSKIPMGKILEKLIEDHIEKR